MSQITKKALAASLKRLLATNTLDKITISHIAQDCGVNRQTFYYHFRDVYDLMDWIYQTEAATLLEENQTYDTWQKGFLQIFEYILQNKSFVLHTYHSMSREHLERFLFRETYRLLRGVVEEKAGNIAVSQEDQSFIANFYKYGFTGLLLEWIQKGMKEDPAAIIYRLNALICGDIEKALQELRQDPFL